MMNVVKRLIREEEGQGMVEYGLIIALVSIAVIGGLTFLAGEDDTKGLKGIFNKITGKLDETTTTTP